MQRFRAARRLKFKLPTTTNDVRATKLITGDRIENCTIWRALYPHSPFEYFNWYLFIDIVLHGLV